MSSPKPWEGLIPPDDVASFFKGSEAANRPISAGHRPALLVVDMTLRFVDSAYPTGHSETGWPAVETNVILLTAARSLDVPVYFTKAYPDQSHVILPQERGRWKTQGLSRPQADQAPGDVIVEALKPLPHEIVVSKGSKPSGFFGTPLASYLIHDQVDTVIITGMTTSGCVRATALDAFMNNFHIIIPHECSADRSQISHKVSLFDLHMKYADVISLAETIDFLDGTSRGRSD